MRRINAGTGPETVDASGAGSPLPALGTLGDARAADGAGARSRSFDSWVPVLFMASGAAGLIYQVVWTQDLVLVFGNTTQAITTTVTAFLAGLGIGAIIGGAVGARLRRALALYGLLEITIGLLALLMPLAFDVIATVFRSAYLSLPPLEVALIRFALAFVALLPVTLLMGMSLPVLTKHLVRADPDVGERIARLYGLNTLGAVAGSVLSGYALIELLGLRGTTFVAVALNVGAGGGAVLISRTLPRTEKPSLADGTERRPRMRGRQQLLLGVTFASGLVSLALELLWTRTMLQGTGSSIYIFVAVVAVFLIGIAGGSLAYERQKHRTPKLATLGALMAVAAGLAPVPLIVSNLTGPAGMPLAVLFIVPVTAIFGYTFPLMVQLFVGSAAQASRGVGFMYAANTAGCVVGTVCAGFVLIPTIGTSASIIALCLLQALIGSVLAVSGAPGTPRFRALVAFSVTAALVLMLLAPAVRLTYVQRQVAATRAPTAHFEDNVASVDPVGSPRPRDRSLFINGFGITRLTVVTKLLAYIPKAARPDATTMLNICFGMGSTYRSSIDLGLDTTAVELDPTVPSVMHWFFPDARRFLHSRLSHIIVNDGRNFVRLTNTRYDLITVDEPPPLWSAWAVVLLTREFYQEVRQRLTPGGVFTALVPYDGATPLLVRTLRASFRYVTVIRPKAFGILMMGSQSPIQFSAGSVMEVFGTPAARADLAAAPDFRPIPVTSWPAALHNLVWLTNSQVSAYTGAGPLLTDDRPTTEYFFLHSLSSGSLSGPPLYERAALETGFVVLGLMVLLIIGLGLEAMSRRRPAASPG